MILRKTKENRQRKPPKHEGIVMAQRKLLTKLDIPLSLATSTCWGCRKILHSSLPERAHIEAFSTGGSDAPDNYLLLCHGCHTHQPDGADIEYQLEWLEKRPQFWEARFDVSPFQTEFERMAETKLKDFCGILMDEHGEKGMLGVLRRTLKGGSLEKAGMTSGNALSNSVAALVRLYRRQYASRHSL